MTAKGSQRLSCIRPGAVDRQACAILFARSPEKGRVKTRLASLLEEDAVLELYRCFVHDILATLMRSGFELRIFFYPPEARKEMRDWLGSAHRYAAQQGEDLGRRMKNAFRSVFNEGFHRSILIGSDVPDLPLCIVEEAVTALSSRDAVVGPARDGGYYLIGFNADRFPQEVFRHIHWGTSTVFQETSRVLRDCGYDVCELPQWRDIDTHEDLLRFMHDHESTPEGCLMTLDYLRACARKQDDQV